MTSAIKRNRAFTFVEVLLVLAIIAIFVGVAVPRLARSADAYKLQNFSHNLFYLSRFLQGEAIGKGRIYCLVVDKNPVTFQGREKVEAEFIPLPGRFGQLYETPAGIRVILEPEGTNRIFFYPDGSIDSVTVRFENQYGEYVSLLIQGTSGQIKIS